MGTGLTLEIVEIWARSVAYILCDVLLAAFTVGFIVLVIVAIREILWQR